MNALQFKQNVSIQQMQDILQTSQSKSSNGTKAPARSFEEILALKKMQDTTPVRFSKHAEKRLIERDIDMTDEQMERLNDGVKKAGLKGINDSLVMVDNLAFIVNIKSSTVITAVADGETNVFSNIDGAVIA